ncbi:MAG TPA: helicase-exonuclease AddAB subunit AddB, partial [Thermoanaerobacterales bacterium]|nr:helicase-exonuclease AddAB subunit AddB [Thermoanaerobacterales bacterium]
MILQFILGRAGTGKTYYCLNEITEQLKKSPQGAPLILLVPEQATLLTEKTLLSFSDIKGIMRAEVLSFQRMTYRVLNEVGGGAKAHIGDLGKKMLIRRLLQKHKDELKIFRWVADRPGFIENLDRTFTELKNYMISIENLQEAFDKLKLLGKNDMLADKLNDLILVYKDLQNILTDKYIESSNYLDLLAQKIRDWSYLDDAEVWVDGFTGFTPQEYVVIREIMKKVTKFNMTLCINPSELKRQVDESSLFYRQCQTMENIIEIGKDIGVCIKKPVILDPDAPYRFKDNPVFAHLEREFFNYPPSPYNNKQESVRIYTASNRRAEIEGAAREIIRLCRDEGYRFRDIYVLLRDMEPYKQLISVIFADNNIPCFIDQKRLVMHHPLVELIRSALEVVVQNWTYDPVFRFLKTDLADIERERVDLLENYVLAHGIKGSKWIGDKPWTYQRKYTLGEEDGSVLKDDVELTQVNYARKEAVKYLSDFYNNIKDKRTVRGYTEALFELLFSLDVPQKLQKWETEARDRGELDLALEHAQIWDCIVDMMDEIVQGLGDEQLTIEEYTEVVESGLKNIRLGLLPLGMDQVVIGDLDRSRNPDVKVVFILGANDGVIPLRHVDEGTFTDSERLDLAKLKVELAPDSRSRLFDEQYYIYV